MNAFHFYVLYVELIRAGILYFPVLPVWNLSSMQYPGVVALTQALHQPLHIYKIYKILHTRKNIPLPIRVEAV